VTNKVFKKFDSLTNRCYIYSNEKIDRNLYRFICEPYFLELAYKNIRSKPKPGNMIPEIVPETLDGISRYFFLQLAESLKNETFQFKPGRRIHIDKDTGVTRPLTIAPPRDKIVQEAMRMILNAIFEPTFNDYSHGFRPNRSCHSALKQIMEKFQPVT
jgi:retron-type reverse transcriptase